MGMNLTEPPIPGRPCEPLGFHAGKALVFQGSADAVMLCARPAVSIFVILVAILVFAAAREMFGFRGGFIALRLVAFDPHLLADSAMATLDVGNAFVVFSALYASCRYVKCPAVWRLIGMSLVVGLALSANHSAILLFPMFVLLAVIEPIRRKKLSPGAPPVPVGRLALRFALALVAIGTVSFILLWGVDGSRCAQADAVPFMPPMERRSSAQRARSVPGC